MGRPKYFLGIEFAYAKRKMMLSQMKYSLDLLQKTSLIGCKPESTPIDPTPAFWDSSTGTYEDVGRYRRLIDKLIYLPVTRPDISYTVGLLSQFMYEPRKIHWQGVLRVLAYIKDTPGRGLVYKRHGHLEVEAYSNSGYRVDRGDRKSTSRYCTYKKPYNLAEQKAKRSITIQCRS